MKPTVRLKKTRPGQHSATPLNAWGSYMTTKLSAQHQGLGASCCCRKLVERCSREATGSGTQYYIKKISKHRYVWTLPLTGCNSRGKCKRKENSNLERMVRWILTANGGSCPLPVIYDFCVSDYSWWQIIDHLLLVIRHRNILSHGLWGEHVRGKIQKW